MLERGCKKSHRKEESVKGKKKGWNPKWGLHRHGRVILKGVHNDGTLEEKGRELCDALGRCEIYRDQ